MGANDGAGLGIGILGFGFMGRTHARAYRAADSAGRPNRIVAVADRDPARVAAGGPHGNLEGEAAVPVVDPRETAIVSRADELLANPEVEAVSVCTHTESHVELALAALRAGKHVLVEKPVALTAREVERLALAARASGRVCMPAMCLRFWPGWRWLRQAVERGAHGKVRSAVFRRLASPPGWSSDFYRDEARSGGALFDLHVHDADFVRWLFGEPASVHVTGSLHHLTASYRFENGPPHVVAEAGWDHTSGFPFHMGFTVVFEQATADYAFGRLAPLVLYQEGVARALPLEEGTGYDGEVRHFLDCCAGKAQPEATIDEAVGLVRMLEAERACLER